MKSWILKNILQGVIEFFNGVIELVGGTIGNIYNLMLDLNNNTSLISGAVTFTTAFAIALVSFIAIVKYLDSYVFEVSDDVDEDPFNYMLKIAESTAFISCNGWIFNTLYKLSNNFYNDLLGSSGSVELPSTFIGLLTSALSNPTGKLAAFAFMLCVVIIAFIINAVIAAKRAGEIILMKIFAPIFYVDLINTNRERFKNFFTGYVFTFVSYSIQMFCFIMALKSSVGIAISNMSYMWVTITWLTLTASAPKFLEKYIYNSGVGGAIKSGTRAAAQTVIMMRR